jgi:dipeptidyl aminopeptidase/acylaminoacyl peptidase
VADRLSADDLYRFRWLSDPQSSPDGSTIAYVVTQPQRDNREKPYRSEIWCVPAAGGEPLRMTSGPRDRHPRWSPDGRTLAFVSNRSGEDQIYALPAAGGEAQPLTARKGGAGSPPVWSPDSSTILFTAKAGQAPGPDESDVRVYTRIRYKLDGQGFFDHRYRQIFATPARVGAPESSPAQVTTGDWDKADPAWSPDGRCIAFTGNPDPDEADLEGGVDIFLVAAAGGTPERVTSCRGPKGGLAFSRDGRFIAYAGHDAHLHGATDAGIWTVAAEPGATPRLLTAGLKATAGDHVGSDSRAEAPGSPPAWSADGGEIRFLATLGGTTHLFAVTTGEAPAVRQLTQGRRSLYGFSGEATAVADPHNPGDLYLGQRRLTDLNAWLRERELSAPEPISCQGAGDWTVEGWVMPPVGLQPGAPARSRPAVLEIHGGPHGCYGEVFFFEFQLLAAAGYAVVYCNPCGSVGYGEQFAKQVQMDWGGRDYRDIMACLDHALATRKWIDPARLGVTGGSYGGYMTNWVVGHTDRFKAAVTDRSTCNRMSHWGTGDVAFHHAGTDFEGFPFDNPDNYLRHSPIMYVRNVVTPILIMAGENDLRCSIQQSEEWFVALRRLGKTAEFVRFPGESHGMSRGGQIRHRIERLERQRAWFDRHIPA